MEDAANTATIQKETLVALVWMVILWPVMGEPVMISMNANLLHSAAMNVWIFQALLCASAG